MKKEKKRKSYKKPEIVYEKKIETLAAVCDTGWTGPGGVAVRKRVASNVPPNY